MAGIYNYPFDLENLSDMTDEELRGVYLIIENIKDTDKKQVYQYFMQLGNGSSRTAFFHWLDILDDIRNEILDHLRDYQGIKPAGTGRTKRKTKKPKKKLNKKK